MYFPAWLYVCVCEAPWVHGVGNGVGLPLIGRDGPF